MIHASAASHGPTGAWVFEPADPEVGLLTDDLTHDCDANQEGEAESAETTGVTRSPIALYGRPYVAEVTAFRCPRCGATTTAVEHWPASFFEE